MSHSITVDDEVYSALESAAKPFVDTPNSVLRRVLGLPEAVEGPVRSESRAPGSAGKKRGEKKQAGSRRTRLPKGELLPEKEYEIPILRSIEARGGAAPAAEVIEDVGRELADHLAHTDHTINDSGLVRWKSRTQFARLNLVKAGELSKDSPRGTWRITDSGRARLARDVTGG